ncbi:MAG: hypothetical protein ACPIOQ_52435, partial [Promethearchaeia archaeon]
MAQAAPTPPGVSPGPDTGVAAHACTLACTRAIMHACVRTHPQITDGRWPECVFPIQADLDIALLSPLLSAVAL